MPLIFSVSSGGRPVILVAMYHTFHEDRYSDLKRWSTIYENVVFDVDVLFHETIPGLLKCSQNEKAIEALRGRLYRFAK